MKGKVWVYNFDSKQTTTLAEFNEDGAIRAGYLDEEDCWATVDEGCRGWKRSAPNQPLTRAVNFRTLDKDKDKDRKSQNGNLSQTVKHVLQRGPWACVLFTATSAIVNVTKEKEYHHCEFKLYEMGSSQEVAPCDFDGENIVVIDRQLSATSPVFRFIRLESKDQVEISELPYASRVTLAKLWGPDCLAYVCGGSTVYFYDYRRRELKQHLNGHSAEIVAMDASDSERIATLSCDAQVVLWHAPSGQLIQSFHVPEATFFLGFPYFLSLLQARILLSADQGAILLEFDG
jgi:WD40 repeat protein